jgi:hypothetical protein
MKKLFYKDFGNLLLFKLISDGGKDIIHKKLRMICLEITGGMLFRQ